VRRLRLATRGSQLARWQAEHVRQRLREAHPGIEVEIIVVRTTGDRITDAPLAALGGTGLFTSELDERVRAGDADAAVHSLKDVPTTAPDGLAIGAVLEREDPRDAFVPAPGKPHALAGLPHGARVGTSSLRRRALLRAARPDIDVVDLRGNLDTRLAKLAQGHCDAAVLACAGIRRLGRTAVIGEILEPPGWLPAPGQGAIAVIARAPDGAVADLLAPLDHAGTHTATTAERAFLRALQGGCQVPIGALATLERDTVTLHGFVSDLSGETRLGGERTAPVADAAAVGRDLASDLLARGAAGILADIRRAATEVSAP
jgi:hydroxymethylbilane synthase